MPDPTTDLLVALQSHRDKLNTLEGIAKSTTDQMRCILTVNLQAFDKHLDSWATTAKQSPLAVEVYSFADMKKRHPEVRLPWNGKGGNNHAP